MDAAAACPACGAKPVRPSAAKYGIALFQIAVSSIFMVIFHFPRFMIVIFGGVILLATILSSHFQANRAAVKVSQQPVSRPFLFRILSLLIALLSLAFVATLVFGLAIFMNAWMRWHQYEGATYHRSDFQVEEVYYQRHGKGTDIYAKGIVEGKRETMNLVPFLDEKPRNQAELDEQVPVGTSIPIYFFPEMKGRARVQVYREIAPADESRQTAMDAFKYGLGGLALNAGIIFILLRLRRLCLHDTNAAFPRAGMQPIH